MCIRDSYLAKYKDATDLADGIEWLFLHEDREEIQKEARRTILNHFAPAVIATKHEELYLELLNAMPK